MCLYMRRLMEMEFILHSLKWDMKVLTVLQKMEIQLNRLRLWQVMRLHRMQNIQNMIILLDFLISHRNVMMEQRKRKQH